MTKRKAGAIDFERLTRAQAASAFRKWPTTIDDWETTGAPRNQDGSFSLPDLIDWMLRREIARIAPQEGTDLKDQKLQKEIEIKTLTIDKMRNETIARSLHESIMSSRAASLRAFLEDTAMLNAHHYLGKNLDQIRVIRFEESRKALEAYRGIPETEGDAQNEKARIQIPGSSTPVLAVQIGESGVSNQTENQKPEEKKS